MKQQLILGPPGTGKTTTLLDIVEQKLNEGIESHEIAFVSFTRKAAHEARERALKKFPQFNRQSFKYFNTLHSVAYRRLELGRTDVMQHSDWKEISHLCNVPFSGFYSSDDGSLPGGMLEGDRFYFHYCLAHARKSDPLDHYQSLPQEERESMDQIKFGRFLKTMKEFKNDTGMLDFSDMLEQAIKIGPASEVKVAIVDEAQDLSKIQWEFVNTIFKDVEELYVAGDDDQAIYRWSGADLTTFLSLQGERTVLERSWRLRQRFGHTRTSLPRRLRTDTKRNGDPMTTTDV